MPNLAQGKGGRAETGRFIQLSLFIGTYSVPGAVLGAGMKGVNRVHDRGYFPGRREGRWAGREQDPQRIMSGVKWVQEHG